MVVDARIVYGKRVEGRPGGERIRGVGWCYEPLCPSNVVKMLNQEGCKVRSHIVHEGCDTLVYHEATEGHYLVRLT